MFIWTIGDLVNIVLLALAMLIGLAVAIPMWIRQYRCKHDGGVNETMACEAICRKCGANLGFIGDWRKSAADSERPK